MVNLFSVRINNNAVNTWLLIARLAVSGLMLTHGIPKLQNVLAGNMQFADPLGIGSTPSLILVVFAEVVCSVLLILGLATRFASVCLIINMIVAVFVALAAQPFAKKELGIFYLILYVGFLLVGAGRYSIDSLLDRKGRNRY